MFICFKAEASAGCALFVFGNGITVLSVFGRRCWCSTLFARDSKAFTPWPGLTFMLVHNTWSNDLRSNDAQFLHKLPKDAYIMQRWICNGKLYFAEWATWLLGFCFISFMRYTPASDKIELIEFLLKLWVQNFVKIVKNREKRKI